jgi:hypothetical protein
MPSSISNSEQRIGRAAAVAAMALAAWLAAVAPMEIAIRAVEATFGRDARFGYPGSDATKLDWFLEIERQEAPPEVLIVGDSQAEYGIHPGVLAKALGKPETAVYNLSFSGTSALTGLEIIRRRGLAPKLVIICISPADFSEPMIARGDKLLAGLSGGEPVTEGLETWRARFDNALRGAFASILRSADPRYHRSLSDYLNLALMPRNLASLSDIGRFITSGRVGREVLAEGRYYIAYFQRGFLGLEMLVPWTIADFERLAVAPSEAYYRQQIFPSYNRDARLRWEDLAGRLGRLKEQGARVVLLRMPAYQPFLELEERETRFGSALDDFATSHSFGVITPAGLPTGFTSDPGMFRDLAHLHAGSAVPFTLWLAARVNEARH